MTDKSVHTHSVSGWPVDSRKPLIYSLKQMMGSKKLNIWEHELSFCHPSEVEVCDRGCLLYWKSLLQTLDVDGSEFGLCVRVWGWNWSWGRYGLNSPWWARSGSKVPLLTQLALCSRPALSLWEFYHFYSHRTYKIGQNTTMRAAHQLL